MVAVQVMGNDAAVSLAASQGHLELNVYLPVCIYNFLQSVRLLSESLDSFRERCICGLKADRTRMKEYLDRSLMLVTALNPVIGYEKAASVAELAYREGLDLRTFRNEQAMLFTYHDPSPETTKQALKRRLLRGFTDYQI